MTCKRCIPCYNSFCNSLSMHRLSPVVKHNLDFYAVLSLLTKANMQNKELERVFLASDKLFR